MVGNYVKNIHYDPLMMQQKEARRKHPCVLPKKVACLVWVPDSALIKNDGCFLRASFCTAAHAATYYSIPILLLP